MQPACHQNLYIGILSDTTDAKDAQPDYPMGYYRLQPQAWGPPSISSPAEKFYVIFNNE